MINTPANQSGFFSVNSTILIYNVTSKPATIIRCKCQANTRARIRMWNAPPIPAVQCFKLQGKRGHKDFKSHNGSSRAHGVSCSAGLASAHSIRIASLGNGRSLACFPPHTASVCVRSFTLSLTTLYVLHPPTHAHIQTNISGGAFILKDLPRNEVMKSSMRRERVCMCTFTMSSAWPF